MDIFSNMEGFVSTWRGSPTRDIFSKLTGLYAAIFLSTLALGINAGDK